MDRHTKESVIDCLTLEREVLAKGGYGSSVRDPRNSPRYFRDSVTCLNGGLEERRHACSDCILIDYVPEAHRREEIPCHHIPLNASGDTIATLESEGPRDEVAKALLGWLDVVLDSEEARP
jgi:hypothetical protein